MNHKKKKCKNKCVFICLSGGGGEGNLFMAKQNFAYSED